MKVTVKKVSYSNSSDRKILQACLQNWFKNPKDLQLTDPRMSYPFDFRKWCSLSYKEENVRSIVAMDKKWIVAYLSVKIIPEKNQAHLFHLFVDKNFRRHGYAKSLLNQAERISKNLSVKNITLHVNPKNDRAIYIYKKFGFIDRGTTARGSIKMIKEL